MSKREERGEPLGEFLRTQRRLARLSLRQLSELANVSNAYLSQVERGLYTPSAHVLRNLSEALHVSAETLYARAGLLDDDETQPPVDVERAISLDDSLTAEQKDALIRVYRSLRGGD